MRYASEWIIRLDKSTRCKRSANDLQRVFFSVMHFVLR